MSTITLRSSLSQALTHQQLDDNFTNLNNDKYESGDDITANTINVLSTALANNLNADLLDDQEGSYYLNYNNFTNTPTIGNAEITIAAGTLLSLASGNGVFALDQSINETITINHDSVTTVPSSASESLTASGTFEALTAVTISAEGHVTAYETTTYTLPSGVSANDPAITFTAGVGLSGGGEITLNQPNTETVSFELDFSELTDMTADISGTTEFILLNGTAESRKAANEIKLSAFNNDLTSVPGNFTIGGDLVINGNSTTISSADLSVEDSIIHLASNNEISDTLDIGFVGHYSNDSGITKRHTGFFRDATDGKYYLFNNYIDAGLDDGTASTINRADGTFALAALSIANLEVTSTAVVTNLNADRLDSQHGSYYLDYNNHTNKPSRWTGTFLMMGA